MKNFDVVGFGALNVDSLFKVNKIAAAEEESYVIDYTEACGGSAANTAVGLARLNCRVGFIGKVGPDRQGQMLIEDFHKEGVDVGGIVQAKHGRSGAAMGFVDRKGERALYIDGGVNDSIELQEVNKKHAFQTDFIHLTSFVGQMSFQTQNSLLKELPQGVRISFDPGSLYTRLGLGKLRSILKQTFVLMPNIGELSLLSGTSDYESGSRTMLEEGTKIVAVKLGSQGCYVTDGKTSHSVGAVKTKVKDTTGAGDAFNAGFLYGLIKGKDLRECGKIGNFVASRCIMKMGARAGLPHLSDLGPLG